MCEKCAINLFICFHVHKFVAYVQSKPVALEILPNKFPFQIGTRLIKNYGFNILIFSIHNYYLMYIWLVFTKKENVNNISATFIIYNKKTFI